MPSAVTMAVSGPVDVGLVEKVTVSDVGVAVVTVPIASLNATESLAAVESKPVPLMTTLAALFGGIPLALIVHADEIELRAIESELRIFLA